MLLGLWERPGQGGAVEPPKKKRSPPVRRWAGVRTYNRGLWAAVLASQPVGRAHRRFQPPVLVTSIREGRSPGGGGGCGCELGKPVEPGRDSRVARRPARGLGQVLGRTRAEDRPGRARRKHLGGGAVAAESRRPGIGRRSAPRAGEHFHKFP